jgi:hypothetical protein
MSVLGTYQPDQVALIAVGVPITGYAPGTFITAERNEDSFALSVGADGDACRTRTNNLSGRITFTLLQSSASNILLSAIANTDERSPAGDGILPSTVKDNSGTTLLTAENSWIVKPANVEYSNETTNREWVVETNELNMLVGGN